jgi:nucleoside-diphosphate-sugar epimerase
VKVFITGITGFLGSSLDAAFRARGDQTAGTTQGSLRRPEHSQYRLGDPFDKAVLDGFNLVIHAAHDFSPDSLDRNISGATRVFEAAQACGVSRQIFLSSYSARPDSTSAYGQVKHAVETELRKRGAAIVRPGLVIGNGGLFARNLRFLMRSPIVPLLEGGRNLIPVIALADFVKAMLRLPDSAQPGSEWNLFHPELITMGSLVKETLRAGGAGGCRPLVVNIPARLALISLSLANAMGLKLPVDANNLRALQSNQAPLYQSQLEQLIGPPTGLMEMTERAVEAFRLSKSGS